jgi:hypothetical protein
VRGIFLVAAFFAAVFFDDAFLAAAFFLLSLVLFWLAVAAAVDSRGRASTELAMLPRSKKLRHQPATPTIRLVRSIVLG